MERIREITVEVATRVIKTAQLDQVDRNSKLRNMTEEALVEYVAGKCWTPSYLQEK